MGPSLSGDPSTVHLLYKKCQLPALGTLHVLICMYVLYMLHIAGVAKRHVLSIFVCHI